MTVAHKQPFGEVVASSLDRCTIQAWEWNTYPSYGSLVQITDSETILVGIVESIITAPLDGARTPTAYKKTDSELKAELPHIFSLLRTTITASILGSKNFENTTLIPPTKPAQIHSFSTAINTQILHEKDNALLIKRIIMTHEPQSADTLIQQFLQHQKNAATLSQEQLHPYIRTYIDIIGNDYKRIFEFNRFIQNL